jgi:oligosaccharide repeat unit polymerase
MCFSRRYVSKREADGIIKKNKNYEKVGIFIMLLFLFPVIIKMIIQLRFVMQHGYVSVFTGEMHNINYPVWTTGSFILFSTGYYIFLASYPPKRKFVKYSILFIIVVALNALKGQRLLLLSIILTSFLWYKKLYDYKIHIKKFFILAGLCLFLAIGIGNIRVLYGNSDSNSNKNTTSLITLVEYFLYYQTTSRAVPMIIIEKELAFHPFPFIFSPLISPILQIGHSNEKGQVREAAENGNDISSVTMYNISRGAYLSGSGYGGSVFAEFYDCGGMLGVILFSVILALLLTYCDYYPIHKCSRIIIPLLYIISSKSLTFARGRFFSFIDYPVLIIYFFIVLSIPLLKLGKKY